MEETPIQKEKFYSSILEIMSDGKQRTAREVGIELKERYLLGDGTRQSAAPRLTELQNKGLVISVGSKVDEITRKRVTVYEKGNSILNVINSIMSSL